MGDRKMSSSGAGLFSGDERHFAETLSELSATNPFLERRIQLEKEALGAEFSEAASYWVPDAGAADLNEARLQRPNLEALGRRALGVALTARARFPRLRGAPPVRDLRTYQDVCLYALLHKYDDLLFRLSSEPDLRPKPLAWYAEFMADHEQLLGIDGVRWPVEIGPDVALSLLFQLRRAFHYVFRYILGSSPVSATLRAETWTSIFTHDLRRYQTSLFGRMHDIVTLITGPTGSGKELVAQAIGLSRYVPFDPKRKAFADSFSKQYQALHLAALPLSLLESELFGHRRGAFTGAIEERVGFLEACGPSGTIFLDEVGELPAEVQVKLLRAIHARTFSRLGESAPRAFLGKLVAATHRDLVQEMRAGRFRADLYHRLSADQIRTPALKERLASDPAELSNLVHLISRRVAGEECSEQVAGETLAFVEERLGPEYPWPGNIRELEQCVRSILVRGRYEPAVTDPNQSQSFDRQLVASGWSSEELVQHYASLMYEHTGSYSEAARRLGMDRRTLKLHATHRATGVGSSAR
jgi:hypothetical protein